MYKLGIIKGLESVSDAKGINVSETMYNSMDEWKQLYSGYYPKWHDTTIRTIGGTIPHKMRSLNMAKVASEEMATLVFNEKCLISIGDDDLAQKIDKVLDRNGFYKEFQRFLEYSFALGGMVIKAHVANEEVKLSYVKADSFMPTGWTNKKITEGVFLNEIVKDDERYTHLEWHEWQGATYVVTNELYEAKASASDIGVKVPIGKLYPDIEPVVEIEGLTSSLFTYIKPNTANNIDLDSPLGISIYANSLDVMNSLDVAFDSFEREFRLGKKRILIPDTAVRAVVDPKSGKSVRYFDPNDEVYQAFKFGDQGENTVKDMSVELRVDEHVAAINALLNLFSMQTGFSAGAFSFDGQAVKTATEVVSENSKTFRTKQSHETIIEAGIVEMVDMIIDLSVLYELIDKPDKEHDVSVMFDDSIAEDKMGELNYWLQLVSAEMASRKLAMQRVLGLTEEAAEKELQAIAAEKQLDLPASIDFFGMNKEEAADDDNDSEDDPENETD